MNIRNQVITLGISSTLLLTSCFVEPPADTTPTNTTVNAEPTVSVEQNDGVYMASASDPDSTSLTYQWAIDGKVISRSSQFDPTQFNEIYGEQTVVLTVSDGNSEATVEVQVVFAELIINQAPTFSVLQNDDIYTITAFDPEEDVLTYKWELDQSILSNSISLNTTEFDNLQGPQTISVSVYDGEHLVSTSIIINFIPTIDLQDLTPLSTTQNETILLSADASSSNNSSLSYTWTIDDIDFQGNNIEYVASTAGTFLVKLIVWDSNNDDVIYKSSETTLEVEAVISNTPPENVRFLQQDHLLISQATDAEDELLHSWFIDGIKISDTSTLDTTSTNYTGLKHVTLLVSDGEFTESYEAFVEFPTLNEPPVSSYTQHGNLFYATSTDDGANLTYQWYLNDVLSGTGQVFNLTEPTELYTIALTTTDSEGLTHTVREVKTPNQAPIASFASSITAGEAPLIVTFDSSLSSDDYETITYHWDFGDSTFSTLENPSHFYRYSGEYEVSLIVEDSHGVYSQPFTTTIIVIEPNQAPSAQINVDVTEGRAPLLVEFDGSESTDDKAIETYTWTINSQTFRGQTVPFLFTTEGIYVVQLQVTDFEGLASSKSIIINVDEPNSAPFVSVDITQTIDANALTVYFDSEGTFDVNPEDTLSYFWDFGDGLQQPALEQVSHTYSSSGQYDVSLTVNDGHIDTVYEQTIIVSDPNYPPTANFNIDIDQSVVTVDATASSDPEMGNLDFLWVFYNENQEIIHSSSTATNSYTFTDIGIKTVELTVSDELNQTDTITQEFEIYQYTSNGGVVLLAENYEAQNVSQNPDGWGVSTYFLSYDNPTLDQHSPLVSVSSDVANRGSKALYVSSDSSNPNYSFKHLDLSPVNNIEKLYVRYFVYSDSTFLGNRPSDDPYESGANVNHFMALAEGSIISNEIRIGEVKGVLGVHDAKTDGIVPDIDYWYGEIDGPRMQAQTWYCIETAFINDGEVSELMTWLDDELITHIDDSSDFSYTADDNKWLDGMFGQLRFGWGVANGSFANEMYFDDIIASNERIGCDEVIEIQETNTGTETDTDTQTEANDYLVDQTVLDAAISATIENDEIAGGNVVYTPVENGLPPSVLPAPVLVTLDTQGNPVEYTLPYPQYIDYGLSYGGAYILDDFNDNNAQNNLAAAISTLHCETAEQGGGQWYVFSGGDASITNEAGLPIFNHNFADAIQDYALHLNLSAGSRDDEYVGFGTPLAFENNAVLLEGLESVEIRIKGSGEITVMFEPTDAYRPMNDWGHYAAPALPLSSSWLTYIIPISSFVGQEYSQLGDNNQTLAQDKEATKLLFNLYEGDTEIVIDYIKFNGDLSIADIPHHDPNAISVADCGLKARLESGDYVQGSFEPISQQYLDFTDIQKPIPAATVTDEGTTPANGSTGIANWLNVEGTKLYDTHGTQVRLTGINWFGFESNEYIPFGLWDASKQGRSYIDILDQIKDLGFNTVQLPFSDEVIMLSRLETNAKLTFGNYDFYNKIDLAANNLAYEDTPLDLMDNIVEYAQEIGLKVILNSHSRQADSYIEEGYWINPDFNFSMQDWIENWQFIADRYKDNDAVIAFNLNNEPHFEAHWADFSANTNWNEAAQTLASAILDVNENALIIIEGVEYLTSDYNSLNKYWWGSNLQGVDNNPIDLDSQARNAKIIYAFHEYGPETYLQPWFIDSNFPRNLKYLWEDRFGFINTNRSGHLLVSDFGLSVYEQGSASSAWFEEFINYIGQRKDGYSWMYASFNTTENSILESDLNSIKSTQMNLLNGLDEMGDDIVDQPSLFAPLIGNQNGQ